MPLDIRMTRLEAKSDLIGKWCLLMHKSCSCHTLIWIAQLANLTCPRRRRHVERSGAAEWDRPRDRYCDPPRVQNSQRGHHTPVSWHVCASAPCTLTLLTSATVLTSAVLIQSVRLHIDTDSELDQAICVCAVRRLVQFWLSWMRAFTCNTPLQTTSIPPEMCALNLSLISCVRADATRPLSSWSTWSRATGCTFRPSTVWIRSTRFPSRHPPSPSLPSLHSHVLTCLTLHLHFLSLYTAGVGSHLQNPALRPHFGAPQVELRRPARDDLGVPQSHQSVRRPLQPFHYSKYLYSVAVQYMYSCNMHPNPFDNVSTSKVSDS